MRPLIRPLFFACLLATTAAGPLRAQEAALAWDQTEQSFNADFDQEEIETTYTFVNNSPKTVTVTKTSATCGCTVPSLAKTAYAPGESGQLKAIFTIGDLKGPQSKTITVETEADGVAQSYQLALKVDIPVGVALKPRVRFWTVGSPATAQTFEVTLHEKRPMRIAGIATKQEQTEDNFEHTIETVREGLEYRITITPRQMHAPARSIYYLVSEDDPKDSLASFPIYAYLR